MTVSALHSTQQLALSGGYIGPDPRTFDWVLEQTGWPAWAFICLLMLAMAIVWALAAAIRRAKRPQNTHSASTRQVVSEGRGIDSGAHPSSEGVSMSGPVND